MMSHGRPTSKGSTAKSAESKGSTPSKNPLVKKSSKPSDKLNPKTIDPFASASKNKSAFATVYSSGGVPCRLVHGSVKHKLVWKPFPEEVPFDPTLVTLAEGIRESVHPYAFVARQGFKELLETPDAGERATPLLPRLAPPLRAALGHTDGSVFEGSLSAITQLSEVVGAAINTHLKVLLVPMAKRLNDRKYRDTIMEALNVLEQNGGKDALLLIKAKIPTYSSIFT